MVAQYYKKTSKFKVCNGLLKVAEGTHCEYKGFPGVYYLEKA